MGYSIIIGGEAGVGKTYNCFSYISSGLQKQAKEGKQSKGFIIDTENKAAITKDEHFKDLKVEIREVEKYDKNLKTDSHATLEAIRAARDEIIASYDQYPVIVFDSLIRLRTPLCHDEWKMEHGGKTPMNAGHWGEINDKVREILEPLLHVSRISPTDVILTAQIGDRYEDRTGMAAAVASGKELKVKDWLAFHTTHIVELWATRANRYRAEFVKSPQGRFEVNDLFMKSLYPYLQKEKTVRIALDRKRA